MRGLVSIDSPLGLGLAFLAGMGASAINAFAGGGSLISFPTLVGLGLPEREANATNGIALWPGSASSAVAYRAHFEKTKTWLWTMLPPTIVGSVTGAILLVASGKAFKFIVPFLILLATVLLALQGKVKEMAKNGKFKTGKGSGMLLQFLVSVYGGYFGAGMGIMMLGVMSLIMDADLHEMNAVKNWLAVVINFGSSVILVSQGLVIWGPALAVMAGALIGGYLSGHWTQKVNSEKLRVWVVVYGFLMSAWYFWSTFSPLLLGGGSK